MLLGKTVFHIRQKGVPPLLLPASVLQLPRCLARICNFFHKNNPIAIWQILKLAIAAGKTDCKIQFASQTWAARPHLGSIFVKLLHRKTFICLRLAPSSPIYIPLTKKSRTYRPALPHAAFALIRFFRTIQPVNHLPASASDNLFQSLCS